MKMENTSFENVSQLKYLKKSNKSKFHSGGNKKDAELWKYLLPFSLESSVFFVCCLKA
jgi:hypothetical protein